MKERPKIFCAYSKRILATSVNREPVTPRVDRNSSVGGQLLTAAAVEDDTEPTLLPDRCRSSMFADEDPDEGAELRGGAVDNSNVRSGSDGGFTSRFLRIPP